MAASRAEGYVRFGCFGAEGAFDAASALVKQDAATIGVVPFAGGFHFLINFS